MATLTLTPIATPSFRDVARGFVELHRMIRAGIDESPEGEALRDAMDPPYETFSPAEAERARWLSEDLYSLGEEPRPLEPKSESAENRLWAEALNAERRGDFDLALLIARECRHSRTQAEISTLRGNIWKEIGCPEVATEFFWHASSLNPSNTTLEASYLDALATSDPNAAARLALSILNKSNETPDALVVIAKSILSGKRPGVSSQNPRGHLSTDSGHESS